jgi:3-deoxy-7-phosphoheptulonate synthase
MTEENLRSSGITENIMVDCSHANSNKNHELQPLVVENVTNQILEGNKSIIGLMIESNINAGNQSITSDIKDLKYGVSVTDSCMDWNTTEVTIRRMHKKLKNTLFDRKI